jgi:hypothetical protein
MRISSLAYALEEIASEEKTGRANFFGSRSSPSSAFERRRPKIAVFAARVARPTLFTGSLPASEATRWSGSSSINHSSSSPGVQSDQCLSSPRSTPILYLQPYLIHSRGRGARGRVRAGSRYAREWHQVQREKLQLQVLLPNRHFPVSMQRGVRRRRGAVAQVA